MEAPVHPVLAVQSEELSASSIATIVENDVLRAFDQAITPARDNVTEKAHSLIVPLSNTLGRLSSV
ncbi:uncharacterized protein N7500_004498 [Penicillium coprophilum]|uniref:uncharacterized protein n=1 Tax=Penicillium coprophilum TaxID=36646 RepID=UPI0023930895|nr:uncharacterized protein N7500_004498 [Penicillium coprophilum]KAJ5162668.1 hypothetical protein N7500_004498 [Penicillium coprophilum]